MLELGQNAAPDAAELIKDGSEQSFMADVIEASKTVPVIVDFWATWCGPCKALSPALEAAVTAAKGKVRLVKIDVDKNQAIAAQLRIQSIPTVYAFIDGQPVDGFQGNQPASQVKAFVEHLAANSPGGDPLGDALDAAEQMLEEGAVTDAAQTFAAILGEDRENLRAIAGFARAHLALGDVTQAKAVLDMVPEDKRSEAAIAAIFAEIELLEASEGAGEVGEARAKLAANPDDHQARLDLALALIADKDPAGAVEELLELFRRDRDWNEGAAKEQLLKLLDSLGPKSEIAQKGRRRLSSLIFS